MGVFKWLRRERVTVTTGHVSPTPTLDVTPTQVGTIRTEEYKRDLAEFQARRSTGSKELQTTPVKKKCGRHSLPVSCTDCTGDPDNTFNYEKKSAIKYKKKSHKRTRSAHSEEKVHDGVPNIQFLFQNQVFMPGNMFATYSEPRQTNRHNSNQCSPDFFIQKHIDFKDDQPLSPPFFYKNNSLPFDTKNFLEGSRSDEEEVDGVKGAADVKTSSPSSGSHRNDSCEDKLWEVMSELKHFDQWADEQLQAPSMNTSKSDDSKSDISTYGLPIASACNLNVTIDKSKAWSNGNWGVLPVQVKKLAGVTIEHVKKKRNMEINILRKCRHPNIILLMGLYPDVNNNIHIICERCVDTLFGILHVQGRILSVQTSVHYTLDVANALIFLHMQGFLHTELSSMSVMITEQDTAKLADLGPCTKLPVAKKKNKGYDVYSSEPQYVNLTNTCDITSESEPLISQHPSESYLSTNAVTKHYKAYSESELYRWQAPELFEPDDEGFVHPCSKSDVYSLCVILWECCNASLPWQSLSYAELRQQYSFRAQLSPAADGSLPGSVLAALRAGLAPRDTRAGLAELRAALHHAQHNLDEMEYIIIPALSKKKTSSSTQPWDTSPTDSDSISPKNIEHKAVVHTRESSNETSNNSSPLYETIRQTNLPTCYTTEKCFISSDDENPPLKFDHLKEIDRSSACSTPLTKLRARIKDVVTPGLHRSDSTEYCSILSPDTRLNNFGLTDDSVKDQSAERPTAKLSRSFTPKSYKPLHIKVPEFNLDSIKTLLKEQNGAERSSYNFNIKNYSLPSTPIARSNKLRKNAWLSGELNENKTNEDNRKAETTKVSATMPNTEETETKVSDAVFTSTDPTLEKKDKSEVLPTKQQGKNDVMSSGSVETIRDSFTGLRRVPLPPADFPGGSPEPLSRARSLGCVRAHDDALARVYVKPLVAIHERWIHEAAQKTGRSMSLPEDSRSRAPAVKPASHCVDTLLTSLPQPRARAAGHWEQYCQAREAVSKSMNFHSHDTNTWTKASEKGTLTEDAITGRPKIDRSTDTLSIEEFIRDLIRKEFHHLLNEISDNTSDSTNSLKKSDDLLNKGVANIMESLKNADEGEQNIKKDSIKSFSRVKINGNNKPLLQITFNRSGENSLQVLDNCVNVTICDPNSGKDKLNLSMEDTLTGEDIQINSLKRCQAFSAIQEARSTEDLYIDDDLSTHMQENFGGRVKLIPLHGSLHEILCERADDCCLVKVKQENGCDTIYFRCDNSDTESRDAVDGSEGPKDTVVFKRSISLVEERIQRIFPKDKRPNPVAALKKLNDKLKTRPKSEIFIKNINKESRVLSNSSPSLFTKEDKSEEVELNIENVMCYQDSSSDECLKCQVENDDFEMLEREIEEDIAKNLNSLTCGCLEKISEENLSLINDDITDKF